MANKVILVNQELCTGCLTCMEACSLSHEGMSSYRRSRIAIAKDKLKGIFVPLLCEMCKGHCIDVCPEEAIHFETDLGMPIIDEEKCNGCMTCVRECPFHGITYDKVNKKALKCDLCGGDPVCVTVCQPGALIAFEPDRDQLFKKYEKACSKMHVYYDKIEPKILKYKKKVETEEVE